MTFTIARCQKFITPLHVSLHKKCPVLAWRRNVGGNKCTQVNFFICSLVLGSYKFPRTFCCYKSTSTLARTIRALFVGLFYRLIMFQHFAQIGVGGV